MRDLVHELCSLGFQDREARVYLALLRYGKCTAQTVAFVADVPRASCYDILEHLVSKSLVVVTTNGEQREYFAEPPERLHFLLKLQGEEITARMKQLTQLLPFLAAVGADAKTQPQIRFFKGVHDLKELQAEFFTWEGETIQLVGYDALLALDPVRSIVSKEHKKLQTKQKTGRAIMVTDGQAPEGIFETRVLPTSAISVPGEITVCGDRVVLFAYTHDVMAVEIHSPAIAQTCRAGLELAWKYAGELEAQLKGDKLTPS